MSNEKIMVRLMVWEIWYIMKVITADYPPMLKVPLDGQ